MATPPAQSTDTLLDYKVAGTPDINTRVGGRENSNLAQAANDAAYIANQMEVQFRPHPEYSLL